MANTAGVMKRWKGEESGLVARGERGKNVNGFRPRQTQSNLFTLIARNAKYLRLSISSGTSKLNMSERPVMALV